MTGTRPLLARNLPRAALRLHTVLLIAISLTVVANVVAAKSRSPSTPDTLILFDIPAQPLASALKAFIQASSAQVLFETALTDGRRSTAVKKRFTPEAALRALLANSGLIAQRTDHDAFIIRSKPQQSAGTSASIVQPDHRFLGALQQGVLDALCRDALTRPGRYKVAVELWIESSGIVRRSALIGSTGDTARDSALIGTLRGVRIAMPPPQGLAQPLILTIAARSPQQTGDCMD